MLLGAKNLCFGMSGISRALDDLVTKIGIFPGYFSFNLSISPKVRKSRSIYLIK
jgi:hypothetical protein